MEERFISFLKSRKKRTIQLSELETLVSGEIDYMKFAELILSFEKKNVLTRVKAHGDNQKNPSLALTYRIHQNQFKQKLHEKLKAARLELHPAINLEAYFHMSEEQWEKDEPFIHKVHHYITNNGFPSENVPAPERSFELVEDEKWITEGGGQELLERICVWEDLLIMPVSDPLMFAINPARFHNETQLHLIVENKTTYQGLLPALEGSTFTTLIYGSGKKIIKSIEQFHYQLPLPSRKHQFYYFGDLDFEGILIWYLLSKKVSVVPALPFYAACLNKRYAFGKQNQRNNDEAYDAFCQYLNKEQQANLIRMFQNGGYYPQEIIKTKELQEIWRSATWM